jgi:phage terminase large subunit-like protein
MIDGPSGLMHVWPKSQAPDYRANRRKIVFHNGAIGYIYTAETPNRLRGPQHDLGWLDEIAAFRYPEAIDMFMLGLRMGDDPRACLTTTPKPTKMMKQLIADPRTHVTYGTTYDNLENLAPSFIRQIIQRYEGTELGEQEIRGQMIEDILGAIWKRSWLDASRVPSSPAYTKEILAVDPGGLSESPDADDTGIVAQGLTEDGRCLTFADLSGHYSAEVWPRVISDACKAYDIGCVIAEANQGGLLVRTAIAKVNPDILVLLYRANLSKRLRAIPIAQATQQGHYGHVGTLSDLENEQCGWTEDLKPRWSPNRMDAAVLGATFFLKPEVLRPAFSPMQLIGQAMDRQRLRRFG